MLSQWCQFVMSLNLRQLKKIQNYKTFYGLFKKKLTIHPLSSVNISQYTCNEKSFALLILG